MKSKSYLDFVGKHACCVTGKRYNIDLHHESLLWKFSGARKNRFDYGALPIHHAEHLNERHGWGKEAFWEHYGLDPYTIAINLIESYLTTSPEDADKAREAMEMIIDERARQRS